MELSTVLLRNIERYAKCTKSKDMSSRFKSEINK